MRLRVPFWEQIVRSLSTCLNRSLPERSRFKGSEGDPADRLSRRSLRPLEKARAFGLTRLAIVV